MSEENRVDPYIEFRLSRDEIGNCRSCGESSEGVAFRGHYTDVDNDYSSPVSHFYSHLDENGEPTDESWWLRIQHGVDFFSGEIGEEPPKVKDKVSEILCPVCREKHSKAVSELIGGIFEQE